ncbi:MAG TPA: cyclase family protein [Pyrinomonadaceae bacterium]|nr:cyclase family protein [Acidobacteriota bacterium]HQX57440.1 cyclase family protein [Pyrinomonadaceae bacterium]HQZ96073.1 cyclase family protein [Pyrinomonadaceae bacterium]
MSNYQFVADLSIPLRFGGPQPNAFGVEAALAKTLGDTRDGSSVNFEQLTFIPHCNGTHTECVGHITDARISVRDCLQDIIMRAVLISVEPSTYSGDLVIGIDALKEAGVATGFGALVVRTLPNDETKLSRLYDGENIPPYFTPKAMQYVVECGFKHLLVDLPSIDRLLDQGRLENHRIFWNIDVGSREVDQYTRIRSTVTELIYVPNAVVDGEYLLNLQIAPFESDASPSRPVIFRTV